MSKSYQMSKTRFCVIMSVLVGFIICLIVVVVFEEKARQKDMFDAGLNQELSVVMTDSRDIAGQKKPGSLVVLSNDGLVRDRPARVILTDFSGRSTEFVLTPVDVDYYISSDMNEKNSVELSSTEGWYRRGPLVEKLETADISVKLHLYADVYDSIYG